MSYFPINSDYVITQNNSNFWLMTSKGHWISSHHSRDEAIAACRCWFRCSPSNKRAEQKEARPVKFEKLKAFFKH